LRLRQTFDEDAELYHRARPSYPRGVFDDLAELTGVGPRCRVLEIGCGTGQATVPLAERGCQIVAVELGAGLAAIARRKLAHFPSVEVVVSAFEDWPLPHQPFDVVVAATAWHCDCPPPLRLAKIARSWTNQASSGRRPSVASSGSGRTRPPRTWSCCGPTPATGRWCVRPEQACWTVSPGSSTAATAARSPSAT
jgi:SAM-dependent methyltransferase